MRTTSMVANRKRPTVELQLEVLEDRICPSPAVGDVPSPPSPAGGDVSNTVNTWKPGNVNDNYSNPANWTSNVVPMNGKTAVFDGMVSNSPCNVDINPSTPFTLEYGYDATMTFNSRTVTISSFQDISPTQDYFKIDPVGCTNINFQGESVFANLDIQNEGITHVNFPSGANAVLGENPGYFVDIATDVITPACKIFTYSGWQHTGLRDA